MKTQTDTLHSAQWLTIRKAIPESLDFRKLQLYLKKRISLFDSYSASKLLKRNQKKMHIKRLLENEQSLLESKELLENDLLKIKDAFQALSNEKRLSEKKADQKNQFFSMLSHEIRTPLSGMIGLIRNLLETEVTPHQRECLQALRSASETMLAVTSDSLDLSRLEAGKITCQNVVFNLTEILQSSIQVFQPRAKDKGLDLRLETTGLPARLKGDPSKLHQILMNLLSNAIKFTNEGQVTLNVKHSSTTNTMANLIFTVTDTGCGVPESKIGLLFQEYSQVENNRLNLDPGAGLGLYLTKKLTELMGGHICVYSKENYGSQFIVSIGFETAESSLPSADSKPSEKKNRKQPLSNFRLLVVDDNPVNQLIYETILLRSGAKVELAENGQIALCKLSEQHYDLVLMDVYMPVLDGCQTTEQIRKSTIPHLQKIPILGLSAAGDPDTICKCLLSGMNAHLLKSFQEEELLNQICILLPKVENQNES